jgi:hypothetical protein
MLNVDPKPPKGGLKVCLTSAYLAPVSYYTVLAHAETVFLENFDSYEKQTYRNRCLIATANGIMTLSIPIEKPSGVKLLTRDIRISEHNDWQIHHWRSIESAYNSSPFFEFYKDDFLPFYEKKWNFLWDFNWEIQSKVLELLEIKPDIQLTSEFQKSIDGNVIDLRNNFHPKNETKHIGTRIYYQVFENKFGFLPELSIIDLLFNMGNESQLIIGT